MYRELQTFGQALNQELKTALFPAGAGVDPDEHLETYLSVQRCRRGGSDLHGPGPGCLRRHP